MSGPYEVLERIGLPVREERVVYKKSDGEEIRDFVATGDTIDKFPGDEITDDELSEAGQGPEAIAHLVDSGAMKEKKA